VANCLLRAKDYALALQTFDQILASDPDNVALCTGTGRVALELGDIDLAERCVLIVFSVPISHVSRRPC
jgi:Flp pilus assembly protein TadD